MFRKTTVKIVAANLSVLVILFTGTLFTIYLTSYSQVIKKNTDMLAVYAQAYWQNGNPEGVLEKPPAPAGEGGGKGSATTQRSAFYAVAFSSAGDVITVDNDGEIGLGDEALVALCKPILAQGRENGVRGTWIYHVEHQGTTTLVAILNNQALSDNVSTLLKNTAVVGGAAILVLFLLSVYLARRIVRPLEENHRKQKQFVQDASHELKTPIAVISTNAEMLEREVGDSKWLRNITYENKQMGDLVHQLLALARAENVQPTMTRVNLSRIVTGGVLPFECLAFEKEKTLELSVQDEVYAVGNPEQLGNVVAILLDNALSYSPPGGAIQVILGVSQRTALLSVTNDGPEIPEDKRQALFDRFYRGDTARSGADGHYGLGLAIVKAIVAAHQGKVMVACQQQKVTFSVSIPGLQS